MSFFNAKRNEGSLSCSSCTECHHGKRRKACRMELIVSLFGFQECSPFLFELISWNFYKRRKSMNSGGLTAILPSTSIVEDDSTVA